MRSAWAYFINTSNTFIVYQENVLLDSDFHCQIAGFGLARHFDATIDTFAPSLLNFPAPELLGNCDKCGQPNCEEHETSKTRTTMETDICAFGCLYYTVSTLTYLPCLMMTRLDIF